MMSRTYFVCLSLLILTEALRPQDRITASIQTSHGDWKTGWMELGIHDMPKFRKSDVASVLPVLPKPRENGPLVLLNPNIDVKVSLSFANDRFLVPWLLLYDAQNGRYLETLLVTFEHDEYDILKLSWTPTYASEKPDGPGAQPFDIVYRWKGVQEEDVATAVKIMFFATILLFGWIVYEIVQSKNLEQKSAKRAPPKKAASTSRSAGITTTWRS